jgi:hypothetical protein
MLNLVETVGGFNRKKALEGAICTLRDVARFCGEDVTALQQEMWIRNIK